MRVVKPTLDAWFLDRQLMQVQRDHFLIPFTGEVRIGPVIDAWTEAEGRVPMPAIVVRAVAGVTAELPWLNRMLFRTWMGTRILEFDDVTVNVPVMMNHDGRDLVSATMVAQADRTSVRDIAGQLTDARHRDPSTLPINRMFLDRHDTWLRRARLAVIQSFAYGSPRAYAKGGGGAVAVSSLWHHRPTDARAWGVALGPNSLTVLVLGVHDRPDGRWLSLGMTFDHSLLTGDQIGAASKAFEQRFTDPAASGLMP